LDGAAGLIIAIGLSRIDLGGALSQRRSAGYLAASGVGGRGDVGVDHVRKLRKGSRKKVA